MQDGKQKILKQENPEENTGIRFTVAICPSLVRLPPRGLRRQEPASPDVARPGPVGQVPPVGRVVLPADVLGVVPQGPHLGKHICLECGWHLSPSQRSQRQEGNTHGFANRSERLLCPHLALTLARREPLEWTRDSGGAAWVERRAPQPPRDPGFTPGTSASWAGHLEQNTQPSDPLEGVGII